MSAIEIVSIPYNEAGILNLVVSVSNGRFKGSVEIFTTPDALMAFGDKLTNFPSSIEHTVSFEAGDCSGEYPFHLLLTARTTDNAGHTAIHAHVHDVSSEIEMACSEFNVIAEACSINFLGSSILHWAREPKEMFSWHPRA